MKLTESENTALDHATKALDAANQQDYQQASELYAQAASVDGLDIPLRWQYRNQQALMLAEFGREFRNNAALEDAIKLYEDTVLALAPQDRRHRQLGDVVVVVFEPIPSEVVLDCQNDA